jgi:hypothetical protein
MNKPYLFENRDLLIITKHGKEEVIRPIFNKEFKVNIITSKYFDTDTLGTFSGEIHRTDNALITLRKKCILGMKAEKNDLSIATEGSFGSHPEIFFLPAHEELMMLKDLKNDIEIVERTLVTDTNFSNEKILNAESLRKFAMKIGFPKAGIILKFKNDSELNILKDICDWKTLKETYQKLKNKYDCDVETDMRAMRNPKRLKVISSLTKRLIKKINTLCPNCQAPGFGIVSAERGLPCENCHFGTKSILYHLHGCQKCNYLEKRMFPYDKKFENPMYCDYCNP